jgi:hypothetical protein
MYENQYEVIGMIIENVQNIEYQLIRGIKLYKLNSLFEKYKHVSPYLFQKVDLETKKLAEEMANMTFGQLMGIIRKQDFLSTDDMDYLESLLSKRNQLVHQYFKYNEMNQSDTISKFNYLQNFFQESKSFSEYIKEIVDELENDLSLATKQKGN